MQPFTAGSSEPDASADQSDIPRCSAKGCLAAARHRLNWRNPSIHREARVKIWLACDQHVESLSAFLSSRGFLLGVEAER